MTALPYLTDAQLVELEQVLEQRRSHQQAARPVSIPSDWERSVWEAQEAKRLERVRVAEEDEERARAEREAAQADRAAKYEANASARDAARAELEQLEPALAVAKEAVEKLCDRERELRKEIARWAPR